MKFIKTFEKFKTDDDIAYAGYYDQTIKFSPEEYKQVDDLMPKIIEKIKGPIIPKDTKEIVGTIIYNTSPRVDPYSSEEYSKKGEVYQAKCEIFVGNDNEGAYAYYDRYDRNNTEDNEIVIQQNAFRSAFKKNAFSEFFFGTNDKPQELVKATLLHELTHAKDPLCNHEYTSFDNYYSSPKEFQAFTNQFLALFESLIIKSLSGDSSQKNKDKINRILEDLEDWFVSRQKGFLSGETLDFFHGQFKQNFLQKFAHKIASPFKRFLDNFTEIYLLFTLNNNMNKIFNNSDGSYNYFLNKFVELKERVIFERLTDGKIKAQAQAERLKKENQPKVTDWIEKNVNADPEFKNAKSQIENIKKRMEEGISDLKYNQLIQKAYSIRVKLERFFNEKLKESKSSSPDLHKYCEEIINKIKEEILRDLPNKDSAGRWL